MNQPDTKLPAAAGTALRSQYKLALPITAVALGIIWLSTWWFDTSHTVALAVSIVTLVVGLMAYGIASAMTARRQEQKRLASGSRNAGSRPDGRRLDDALVTPQFSAQLNGRRWTLDVFQAIDAQRFAAVCETWFAWAGFETRSESHRMDGGVDIWLHAAKMPGPVAIVRCRHWMNKPVGLQEMKEFMGLMANFNSAHGTYTTTSTYTPEALQFAKENGIDAVDGRGLLRRIQTRTRQRQQALLAVAFSNQH